jgi:hypothetical protein
MLSQCLHWKSEFNKLNPSVTQTISVLNKLRMLDVSCTVTAVT